MGEHQAKTTAEWAITRRAQDELAVASHRNLAAAWNDGFFDDLTTPYLGVSRDTNMRADSTMESLAKLNPVFGKKLPTEATMTAGNSTPLTDGASSVLLGSEDWADEHGFTPLARLVDAEAAAVDFVDGAEGLLMAPAYAVPRLLARNGLTFDDFDVFEIHEAFASTVLSHLAAWESEEFCTEKAGLDKALGPIDRDKLNPLGSSLAAGHPFAATGGRIIASTAKHLKTTGKKRSLVSICAAGGQGLTAIVGGGMKDTYLSLVNGPLKQVAKTLGLPQPVRTQPLRLDPGQLHEQAGPRPRHRSRRTEPRRSPAGERLRECAGTRRPVRSCGRSSPCSTMPSLRPNSHLSSSRSVRPCDR